MIVKLACTFREPALHPNWPRFGDFESTPVPARDTHSEAEKERDPQYFRLFFFLDLAIAELKNSGQLEI